MNQKYSVTRPHILMGLPVVVFSIIGFVSSFWLVLERLASYKDPSHTASCDISPVLSCTTITQSWQASVFGFPNPLIGVVAFTIGMCYGVLILSRVKLPQWIHYAFLVGIVLGALFVAWLAFQAIVVIKLLCIYCMLVWASTLALLLVSTSYASGRFSSVED